MTLPSNASLQDVINSLNETQGINGKAEMAGVIGSPANATDNIITQAQKLLSGKRQVIEAIEGKGSTVPTDPTFNEIAIAVGNIPLGRKYASGTVTSSDGTNNFQYFGSTASLSSSFIEFTGLDFKPKVITAVYATSNLAAFHITEYNEDWVTGASDSVRTYEAGVASTTQTIAHFKANAMSGYVTGVGFKLPVRLASVSFNWYAWG